MRKFILLKGENYVGRMNEKKIRGRITSLDKKFNVQRIKKKQTMTKEQIILRCHVYTFL